MADMATSSTVPGIELSCVSHKNSTQNSTANVLTDVQTSGIEPNIRSSHLHGEPDRLSFTREQIRTERIHYAVCCWYHFLAGWNDASTGPLFPRIRQVYNVGFTVGSLIFVLACAGFLVGTFLNIPLSDKLGFGKVMLIGSLCQVIAYTIQAPAPPFPLFVISFTISGIGMAMQDAQANAYVAMFKRNPSAKMGILHAIYGVGAFASPLIATQFAQLRHWSFYYLCSIGFAIINVALILVVFRGRTTNELLPMLGIPPGDADASEHSKFKQILTNKTIQFMAFFLLIYVGIEVTIGGWIVTFMQEKRGGGPDAGYISSGFFAGLTIGRVALLWVNKLVGERNAVYLYTFLAIALQLVVWLVPNLYGGAVTVSLVGVILGPFYPIVMNHCGRVLPPWLLTGAIGYIAGMGQAGSALLPFMTGALSGRFGVQSLQPLLVAMMATMMGFWWLVSTSPRKSD
ncbi:major facilitator superfamily domain-containing protein [Flagelloscypha sp. PMI_526]|nr:major facilitator superfamily domain-containing protein [Flagelloscypha sp. PMI_526]